MPAADNALRMPDLYRAPGGLRERPCGLFGSLHGVLLLLPGETFYEKPGAALEVVLVGGAVLAQAGEENFAGYLWYERPDVGAGAGGGVVRAELA